MDHHKLYNFYKILPQILSDFFHKCLQKETEVPIPPVWFPGQTDALISFTWGSIEEHI